MQVWLRYDNDWCHISHYQIQHSTLLSGCANKYWLHCCRRVLPPKLRCWWYCWSIEGNYDDKGALQPFSNLNWRNGTLSSRWPAVWWSMQLCLLHWLCKWPVSLEGQSDQKISLHYFVCIILSAFRILISWKLMTADAHFDWQWKLMLLYQRCNMPTQWYNNKRCTIHIDNCHTAVVLFDQVYFVPHLALLPEITTGNIGTINTQRITGNQAQVPPLQQIILYVFN